MAGMKGITVNTAPEAEPHIYAEDDAAIYQAIFGGDGVSTIGQACKATVLSNNKVRIADGVICVGGHMARIPYGEYCDCEIANGQSGKNRNDIIVAKFLTTGTGGIDTMTCEVKEGVADTTAADPALTQDDVYTGGKIRECPLYRVKIEGLSIVAVEQLFDLKPTAEELKELIDETNSDLTDSLNPDFEEVTKSYGLTVHHAQVGKFHLMRIAGNPSGALTTHTITLPDKCKDGFFLSESGFTVDYRFLVEKNGTQLKITSASGSIPRNIYICKWLVYYG